MHYYTRLVKALEAVKDVHFYVHLGIKQADVPVPDRLRNPILEDILRAQAALRDACDKAYALSSSAPHVCHNEVTLSDDDIAEGVQILNGTIEVDF